MRLYMCIYETKIYVTVYIVYMRLYMCIYETKIYITVYIVYMRLNMCIYKTKIYTHVCHCIHSVYETIHVYIRD